MAARRIPGFIVPIGNTTMRIPINTLSDAVDFVQGEFAAIVGDGLLLPGDLGSAQYPAFNRAHHFEKWCEVHLHLADPFDDRNLEVRCWDRPRVWSTLVRRLRAVYVAIREVAAILEKLKSGEKDPRALTEDERAVVLCWRYDGVWKKQIEEIEELLWTREGLEELEKTMEQFPEPDSDVDEDPPEKRFFKMEN